MDFYLHKNMYGNLLVYITRLSKCIQGDLDTRICEMAIGDVLKLFENVMLYATAQWDCTFPQRCSRPKLLWSHFDQ